MDLNNDKYKEGFFTGDFILSATEANWDEIDSATSNWNPNLNYVAGNHDVGDRSLFRDRHAETNRSFIKKNDLYVILDLNSTGWNITDIQWSMIDSAILKNQKDFRNVFIMTHQLFFINKGPAFAGIEPNSFDGKAPKLDFFEKYLARINEVNSNFFFFCGDVGAHSGNCYPGGYKHKNLKIIFSGIGSSKADHFISAKILPDSVQLQINYLTPERVEVISENFYIDLKP